MTACAPNTYHRPHRARTGCSAVSSSSAAGWRGTLEELGKTRVRAHIVLPEPRIGPLGMLQEHLSAQFIRDAESLDGTKALDARGPVGILALADRGPVAPDKLLNAAGDHAGIVAPSPRGTAIGHLLDQNVPDPFPRATVPNALTTFRD